MQKTTTISRTLLGNALLFGFMGSGPGWLLSTSISQEIPYFQNYQPEGLCLSSRLTFMMNAGLVIALFYYLTNKYLVSISHEAAIVFLMAFITITTFLAAFNYSGVADGISLNLYIFAFLSGVVGNLMYQTLYPFLMKYERTYMIAARAGSDSLSAIVAFIALAQDPGIFSHSYVHTTAALTVLPLIILPSYPRFFQPSFFSLCIFDGSRSVPHDHSNICLL